MNFKWMTAAVLTLGTSAFVPSLAKADRFDDHDRGRIHEREERVEHGRWERERVIPRYEERRVVVREEPRVVVREERPVVIREEPVRTVFVRVCGVDLPQCVLDTATLEGNGRTIARVERVCTNGCDTFVVRECAPGKEDISLSIAPDGRLLSIARLG